MTTNRPYTKRVVSGVVTLAAATAMACLSGTAASAEPPAVIVDPCSELLAQAAQWPGEVADGTRHFSDAYDSYLSRQPVCATGN